MTVRVWASCSSSSFGRLKSLVTLPSFVMAGMILGGVALGDEQEKDGVRFVKPDDSARTSAAVVVPARLNLAHTAQILPLDERGSVIGPDRAEDQAKVVLDRLEATLKEVGAGFDQLVKVNVYAKRSDVLPAFRTAFASRISGQARPALSVVTGVLAHPEALVAVDAVAVTDQAPRPLAKAPAGQLTGAPVAILPAGAKVYVSGQAEPHADLAESTRRTLKSLEKTLAYLGLDQSHVVQIKAFMEPMSAVAVVEREFSAFFGAGAVPPLSYVEWRSSPNQPIEIELIARAGPRAETEALEVLTPTGMKPSPVFSRVARVNRGDLVYVSGLFGPSQTKGKEQVEVIFGTLKSLLDETGSDFRHLAKATYYVVDDDASRALNDLRPNYYDPKIPPAASKAMVPGVGSDDRTITLDMIGVAVPKAQSEANGPKSSNP